ncbi:MAG: HAMP domain-containing sensor histidine kinase [Gemmatimonadota bacterium]|jgi:signal transduction histidine kinase
MSPNPPTTVESPTACVAVDVDRVLERWVSSVRDHASRPRSVELIDTYQELGRVVLERAVPRIDADLDEEAARHRARAITGVAAAVRREELTIADALGDLQQLVPAFLAQAGGGDDKAALQCTVRLCAALDPAQLRIVRVVEAAAHRARREHRAALAALTDQLSHELQNRLGAARTASQMLLPSGVELGEIDLTRVGELVQTSVEAALRTVDDVKELVASRGEHERRELRRVPLPRLVRSVIDDLSPPAFEVGVDVSTDGSIVDCQVDAGRFRLIVFNLIGNGIKYRDRAKRDSWVRVASESLETGEVRLVVSDNGVGISAEHIEDIFMPHARGAGTGDVPGTGLGLAIVHEAVEQIGGLIEVESEVGEGTTFTVTFHPVEPDGSA